MLPSAKKFLEITNNTSPDIAVILGSGLTNFFDKENILLTISYESLPDFPQPTVKGHAGKLVLGKIAFNLVKVGTIGPSLFFLYSISFRLYFESILSCVILKNSSSICSTSIGCLEDKDMISVSCKSWSSSVRQHNTSRPSDCS